MTLQLFQTVLGAALLVTSLAAWAAGLAYVRWDAHRRRLPEWQRTAWTLLALWPLVGLTLYVLVAARAALVAERRGAAAPNVPGLAWPDEGLAPRQRVTLPRTAGASRRRLATQPVGDAPHHQPLIPTAPVPAVGRALAGATQPAADLASPVEPHYCLAALEGPHAGQSFDLYALPARIGRGAEVAVRLDADLGVSRRHAELYQQAGVLRLRDTSSAHGTTVNGYTITDKGLAPGDRIRVGHSLLQLRRAEPGAGGEA